MKPTQLKGVVTILIVLGLVVLIGVVGATVASPQFFGLVILAIVIGFFWMIG